MSDEDSHRFPPTPNDSTVSIGDEAESGFGSSLRARPTADRSGGDPAGSNDDPRPSSMTIREADGEAEGSLQGPLSAGTATAEPAASGDGHDRDRTGSEFVPGDRIADRYEVVERLGRGGFGAVYRAYDDHLRRDVAIKRASGLRSFVAGQIRVEAQAIASLNHPGIVSIYDLVSLADQDLLIVMECLEGMTLAEQLRRETLATTRAVRVLTEIAEALGHAHERKLVHSDLKPSNVFLDRQGRVRILDFGLAVAYRPDQGHTRVGGTPGYMAPEQVRGESHRIDGRADIWALGVIAYEMLSGTKPFVGADAKAVCEATLKRDPPPLRQFNPGLDPELQRIIGRCLEKRMSDRYDSIPSLLDDLHRLRADWGPVAVNAGGGGKPGEEPGSSNSDTVVSTPGVASRGLCPFTEEDVEPYLTLVPGPKDRHGVPESIRFWQRWVESDDPETHFPVGVLYGPSGSGKTSYVRAGLLPRLGRSVCRVYVECRPGNLGERITRIIQSRLQEASGDSSLRDLLSRLRVSDSSRRGFRKLLIVLDQFEAWSEHASFAERQEFADALRQCDGIQIRALVVARDDHWMGVTELLRWLELPLQEGRNIASVNLLDAAFALRTLESMGREMGALPPAGRPLSLRQTQFLQRAVEELSHHGTVICAHLVMFAQMMRDGKWEPRSLRASGGVAGACSLYLQELFGGRGKGHSPEYRRVAPAVRCLLSELLPPAGESVASAIRSRSDLYAAIDRAGSGPLFDDAIRLLTEDLRILTPASPDEVAGFDRSTASSEAAAPAPDSSPPEGAADATETPVDATAAATVSAASYRLSHDFLVTPIAMWLDRDRRRTWRGRARMRLKELSEIWGRRPVRDHLPNFIDYLTLVFGTGLSGHDEAESDYLRAATRLHAGRISLAVVSLLAFFGMTVVAGWQYREASSAKRRVLTSNVDLLFNGPPADIAKHIASLKEFGGAAAEEVDRWRQSVDEGTQLRAELFLQSQTPRSIARLAGWLEEAPDELFQPVLDVARGAEDSREVLREVVESSESTIKEATRAAVLLLHLGEPASIERLLAGSTDADRDREILLNASTWRGEPQRWLELVEDPDRPAEVRHHAAVVLCTWPRREFVNRNLVPDFSGLINAAEAPVHSAGRYLAAHWGERVEAIPMDPPEEADWKVGPDNIPFLRISPGRVSFPARRTSEKRTDVAAVRSPIWFSEIPVTRRLYRQFTTDSDRLDDGDEVKPAGTDPEAPDALKSDPDQPVSHISFAAAISFCNWLSRREGLTPCYTHRDDEPMIALGEDGREVPGVPWRVDETANGYRLPSLEEFVYVARGGYSAGNPWMHARPLALLGEKITVIEDANFIQPRFSLMPNRWGVFVNDIDSQSWIGGSDRFSSIGLYGQGHFRGYYFARQEARSKIFLAQTISETTPP